MNCPICRNNDHIEYNLHSEGFAEGIMECGICGTIWSVNHGSTKIVKDPQEKSFLGAVADFYYSFAA